MSAKPVVAATDGSEESLRAIEWAAREAVLRAAPLRIVSAVALLPRMVEHREGTELATVTDALSQDSNLALAAGAERAPGCHPAC
jgi:nucleotide-binding universal stress UspA family protein